MDTTEIQVGSVADKARVMTLADLDGRTMAARRARALVQSITVDLGGSQRITAAQHELIVRAAVLGALIQDSEVRLLTGTSTDLSDYLAAVNAQRRVLVTLGISKHAREMHPDLTGYLKGRA